MKKAIIIRLQDFVGCIYGLTYEKLVKLANFRAANGVILKRFKTIEYTDLDHLNKLLEKHGVTSCFEITNEMYEAEILNHFEIETPKQDCNGYEVFLLIQLALQLGIIDSNNEYDLMYEEGIGLYAEFENSNFNVHYLGAYDCIVNFLNDKASLMLYGKKAKQSLIDSVCNKIVEDVHYQDLTAIDELLGFVPVQYLKGYLAED